MDEFLDKIDGGLKKRIWEVALARGGDFAEVFMEDTSSLSFMLKDGRVSELSQGRRQGLGVRVVDGDNYGYAWLDGWDENGLLDAAETAAAIASGGHPRVEPVRPVKMQDLYPVAAPMSELGLRAKMDTLHEANESVRAFSPHISQVILTHSESLRSFRVIASDGTDARDTQPLVRLGCMTIATREDKRARGAFAFGGRVGQELLQDKRPAEQFIRSAEMAVTMLDARPLKGGPMPVVLGPGWGGVLLHEAVGHGLEGDFNFKGTSLFAGRIGQEVASKLVTVVDDATIPHHRGSINIDDEGVPGARKTLIENGVLRGYMHDRISARQLGVDPTGNGRRESYRHPPVPRMTNTFMTGGESNPADIIAATRDGFFAKTFGGGQVDITNGNFVFEVLEGYRIENGEVTYPVEGATLIGNGPEALGKVDMVGNDFQLCTGVGTCGKSGQGAPVGVGQPTNRISEMTVGGRG